MELFIFEANIGGCTMYGEMPRSAELTVLTVAHARCSMFHSRMRKSMKAVLQASHSYQGTACAGDECDCYGLLWHPREDGCKHTPTPELLMSSQ